ncbi:MAG: hypothetical protein JW834_01100, partial [Candidatus Diapherotrites archaeon]|nr:hypothetical protein [Candidatus Diapherotrites archaeon]
MKLLKDAYARVYWFLEDHNIPPKLAGMASAIVAMGVIAFILISLVFPKTVLTVSVRSGGEPLEGATVSVSQKSFNIVKTTDSNGEAVLYVDKAETEVRVHKEGCDEKVRQIDPSRQPLLEVRLQC